MPKNESENLSNRPQALPRNSAPYGYLFGAYYKGMKNTGKLTPIANTLLFAYKPGEDKISSEKPMLWATDFKGALFPVHTKTLRRRTKPIHALDKRNFIIPPPEVVSFIKQKFDSNQKDSDSSTTPSDQWLIELMSELKNNMPSPAIQTLKLEERRRSDLANPSEEQINEPYGKWYKNLKEDAILLAHIIPRIRSLLFFSNANLPIDFGKDVQLIRPNSSLGDTYTISWLGRPFGEYRIGIVTGTRISLPDGIYKFQIPLIENSDLTPWNNIVSNTGPSNSPHYILAEMARFDIKNPAGEFQILSLDPISLEESLITQHARSYKHLLELISSSDPTLKKKDSNAVESKDTKIADQSQTSTMPDGFKQFVKTWGLLKATGEMAAGVGATDLGTTFDARGRPSVSAAGEIFSHIGKALHFYSGTSEDTTLTTLLEAGMVLASGKATVSSLMEIRPNLAESFRQFSDWRTVLTPDLLTTHVSTATPTAHTRTAGGYVGIPEPVMKHFGTVLARADLAINTVALSKSTFNHFVSTIPALGTAKKDFSTVARSYFEQLKQRDIRESVVLKGLFKLNSAIVDEVSDGESLREEIQRYMPYIKTAIDSQDDIRLYVLGYTCDLGTVAFNQKLSEDRAKAVAKILVDEHNIDESILRVIGCGESAVDIENPTEEERKNFRKVVLVANTEGKSLIAPSREGIGTMERFRTVALQREMAIDEAEIKLALQALDVALGVMGCIPLTATAAWAFITLKEAAKGVYSLLLAADKFVADNALKTLIDDFQKERKLKKESDLNQLHLCEIFEPYEDQTQWPGEARWAGQFRIRAEVLGGLIHLLMEAAFESDSGEITYEQALEKYSVKAYIQNFILSDGWLYPLEGDVTLSMSTYWLFAIKNYNNQRQEYDTKAVQFGLNQDNQQLSAEKREALMEAAQAEINKRQDHPKMVGFGAAAGAGSGVYFLSRILRPYVDKHLSVAFQRYFPIHYFSALTSNDEFNKFAQTFKPIIRHITAVDIEYTRVYYQHKKSKRWIPFLKHTNFLARFTDDIPAVDPTTPIRVLVVFKKRDDLPPVFPLRFQVDRVDGMNVPGPKYKTVAKPLIKSDLALPEEEKYIGYHGCVFHPFYQLWDKTYFGIKPMIAGEIRSFIGDHQDTLDDALLGPGGQVISSVADYFGTSPGDMNDMKYHITCKIADMAKDPIPIPLKSRKDEDGYVVNNTDWFSIVRDEVPVKLDPSHPLHASMLEVGFLRSGASEFKLPKLFKGKQRVNWALKIGEKGPFINVEANALPFQDSKFKPQIAEAQQANGLKITDKGGDVLRYEEFDWRQPVEILTTFSVEEILKNNYEDKPVDWRKFGCSAKLFTDAHSSLRSINFLDHEGPTLSTHMVFLGKLTLSNGELTRYDPTDVSFKSVGNAEKPVMLELYEKLKKINDNSLSDLEKKELQAQFPNPDAQDVAKRFMHEWYIFAAVFKCSYYSPKRVKVNSIRPFGKGIFECAGDEETITYYLRNFRSQGEKTGLFIEKANAGVGSSINREAEPRFELSMPSSFTNAGLPWTELPPLEQIHFFEKVNPRYFEDLQRPNLRADEAKQWLEDDAKVAGQKPIGSV